jgi:hypothetical protein
MVPDNTSVDRAALPIVSCICFHEKASSVKDATPVAVAARRVLRGPPSGSKGRRRRRSAERQ